MNIKDFLKENSKTIANEIISSNGCDLLKKNISGYGMKHKVDEIIDDLKAALFPSVYESELSDDEFIEVYVRERINNATIKLNKIVREVFVNICEESKKKKEICDKCKEKADKVTVEFMNKLPEIRKLLSTDIEAAYNGDPAAKSHEEILLSYPCIEAITIQRLAHELYLLKVPFIPRIMTEHAHSSTGIDIHPGATIGEYFFIDHATGVVIGETCVIGNNVKLYQGVTLGAKSFELDDDGNPVKGVKRHPNIEDNVIVYAGATILGGDTTIGKGSVIGGSVWLTKSVPPHSSVYNTTPTLQVVKSMKK